MLEFSFEIDIAALFYFSLSEITARLLGVVTKRMEFAGKQGYYNIAFTTNGNCVFIPSNFD